MMKSLIIISTLFCIATLTTSQSSLNQFPLILTPYIEKNNTDAARSASRVDPTKFLNVSSHSGFLTVDAGKNTNLFFWYFPVADKPLNATPWIVWLQGGPGASSLAGLFLEIGPFQYDKELKLRNSSWSKEYSLLFIDNPVGAGYSFTESNDGYVHNMDECSEQLYGALQQFLEIFPEHRHAPLYLAGESYAGHFIPALAHKILHPPAQLQRSSIKDTSINLMGLMMGSPLIDRRDSVDLASAFYQWGVLDHQGMLAVKPLQEQYKKAVADNNNAEAYKLRNDLLDRITELTYQRQSYNVLTDDVALESFMEFLQRPEIADAIHVGHRRFIFSNSEVHVKLIPDFLVRASSKVEELLEHYKILIFCGQLDLTVPYVPNAEGRRKNWHWSHRDDFLKAPRLPWWFNNSVAGYVKNGGGLTEVLVKGAGHLIPLDKPSQVKEMVSHFIKGIDFPLPTNVKESDIETPPYTDDTNDTTSSTAQSKSGIIASAVLNVILVLIIILGVIYWVRWKKRTETYFYSMVDNSSLEDGVLTMN
ncbi:unnamed protein product [Diatraea saccharalis]|uniref:Carboxypeptidase n=1 Tax=Diatraea saccharalis TaxID=40085 RepID=A0A9N9QVK5_9NEOP|nr:unnamed protein product [Diatraea saccharalis]